MFLSEQEIRKATGVSQPAAQIRRLRALGLSPWRNAKNEVCALRSELEAAQGKQGRHKPRLDRLRRAG